MRKLIFTLIGLPVLALAYYGVWHSMVAADVAQVKATIKYQNEQFKTVTRDIVLKADSVSGTGFPFHFRVKVARATLSMIDGKDTYAVSLPEVTLESADASEGRYRVFLPQSFDALYATDGQAPENYKITLNAVPQALLRAQGASSQCSDLPGAQHCADTTPDAPLISFAVKLPSRLILRMALNGDSRDVGFSPLSLGVPVFMPIPANMSQPLQIFVGLLRETLVFKTGQPKN